MKKTKNMLLSIGLSFAMIATFVCSVPARAAETKADPAVTTTSTTEAKSVKTKANNIQKYGHLDLVVTPEEMAEAGFEHGDVVTVKLNGMSFDAPFVTDYNDVGRGELLLRDRDGLIVFAINYGTIATEAKIADKNEKVLDDKGFPTWDFNYDVKSLDEVEIEIVMKEKAGFLEEWKIANLEWTKNREDYSSDAVFANFRNVKVGQMDADIFYRSSSPVNNGIGRAAFADKLAKEAGIKTVMNIADSEKGIEAYFEGDDYDSPYYKSLYEDGAVIALNMGVNFLEEGWAENLVKGLKFLAEKEGPYLVHCNEGKDRAGIASAVIEALMGASYEEIYKDYMTTFINYYKLKENDETYTSVKTKQIDQILRTICGEKEDADLTKVDITAGVEKYVKAAGLTDEELAALRKNIAKDYKAPEPAAPSAPAAELTDIADSWAKDDITSLLALGYVTGYPDKTFRPKSPITRAECMAIINKALKLTEESDKVADFVDAEGWFKADIAKALAKGYIKGIDETHIGPDNNITREEVFAIVKRIAALPDGAAADIKAFGDASSVSGWAVPEVAAVVKAGIVTGDGGNLRPTDPLTRAEAARLISNILKVLASLQAAPQ